MTSTEASKIREREVRLGIVLYGGVSLAVYENGVAQELFRAVKGEGVYTLIKYLIDSDVVVDIVSGTSAGGVNGIMLGYALANDRDFRASARLWREDGDILRLLRKPSEDATSLLDSRGYYQERLEEAFEGMPGYLPPGNDGVPPAGRIVSSTDELDLFVTGTDIQGHTYTAFDEDGHPIDVKDHRAVFQLSYRSGRKNEFSPEGSVSLATLARITSCFPVAFEPVQVTTGDKLLHRWGSLDTRANIFFMDGGVLNNKPFSYTIDAILRRTADRDVERMLLYVEPNPESFRDENQLKAAPNVAQAAVDALIGIPGYQSISADLQAIAQHNDQVQLYGDIQGCVAQPKEMADCLAAPDENRTAAQIDASNWDAITDTSRRGMYRTARLNRLRDRAVEGILKKSGERTLLTGDEKHAAIILVKSFSGWDTRPNDSAAAIGESTLHEFDVDFRMRRLLDFCDFIKERLYPGPGTARAGAVPQHKEPHSLIEHEELRELWRRLNHQFNLLEEIQYEMGAAIDAAYIPWDDLSGENASQEAAIERWKMAQSVLVSILDTNNLSLSAAAKAPSRDERPGPEATKAQRQAEVKERETLMAELRARIKGFQKQAEDKISPPQCKAAGNLLLRCDELEREIVRQFAPGGLTGAVAVRYCSFLVTDSYLFPMQRMARINSFEEIQTVRISPIDARRAYSAQPLDAKLCGNSLANFSGFLKRSWRANDTMWGRLDGVCQLIECLVTHDRVKKVGKRSIDVSRLRVMFPHASQADLQQISDLTSRIGTLLEPEFQNLLDSLVRAAQAEILEEEVPRVIDAAIRQHADWNEFPLAKQDAPLMSVRQVWRISPKRLDTAVTGYASGQLSINMVPPGGWTHYFEDIYRVGLETWKDGVPPTILGEIVTQAALVMANCLMGTVGSNASKIRGYRIYRALHVPAQLAYRAMRIQRTAPEFSWSIYVALALSAGLLILDIPFIRKILFGAQSSSPNWELWAIPAVIAALTLTWIGIRVYLARAQRPVAQPDRGILQALSRITELPDAETDSLVLNRYSWNHHAPQPGAVIDPAGRISNPVPGPPLAYTGPVQTFCARETANRELREALAKEVFAGLPVNTNWMEIQVEQLSVQQPATKLEHWLLQNKELANLNSPGKSVTVVRQVYAGKLVVTTRLARAKPKFDKDELNAKLNARGFRIRSTETDDPSKEIRIVSLQPVVFAYLAGEASLQRNASGDERIDIRPLQSEPIMRRVWSSVPWPRRDDAPKPGTESAKMSGHDRK